VGLLAMLLGLLLVTAACDPEAPLPAPSGLTPAPAASEVALRPVTVALPFRPDVQFAPLYLAQERGYYRDEGLDVTFEYGDEAEQLRLVASGTMPAMIAGGDQVILARAADVPVTYVMTWFQRFPVAVFSLDPQLQEPADLVGRRVGLPANSGTSYLGWQALLSDSGIDPAEVQSEVIGFTQRSAVADGTVDAAVGYVNNEPLQLRAEGREVSVIEIADEVNLVSNGLVVGQATLEEDPALVQGLVTATLRGISDTLDDPDAAFEAVLERVPETADPAVRGTQREVLEASLPLWRPGRLGDDLGGMDRQAWERSQDLMQQLGLISKTSPLEQLYNEVFVLESGVRWNR
jgi:NitT/TauT family transport system substrate-binding protein